MNSSAAFAKKKLSSVDDLGMATTSIQSTLHFFHKVVAPCFSQVGLVNRLYGFTVDNDDDPTPGY